MKQVYTLKFINFKQEQNLLIESNRSVQELIEMGIQNLQLTKQPTYEIISRTPIELNLQLQSLPQSMHNRLTIKLIYEIEVDFYSEDYDSSSIEKVNIFDKLIELNMMIHQTLGISSAPQKIQYQLGSRSLNPLKTLYKLNIVQDQQIKYTISCQFFVQHNQKKIFFQCKINELISKIKQDIINSFEIQENFDLKYENQTLLDEDEYGFYSVPLNHIFCLQIIDSIRLRVSFQGKTQNIEIYLSETVQILINFFTNLKSFSLIHGGQALNNQETFKNLNLPNNSLLELKSQLEIYYYLDGFEGILKETVLEGQTFQDLLNKIKKECGVPAEYSIQILLNEREIDPNKTIAFADQQNQYVVRINE